MSSRRKGEDQGDEKEEEFRNCKKSLLTNVLYVWAVYWLAQSIAGCLLHASQPETDLLFTCFRAYRSFLSNKSFLQEKNGNILVGGYPPPYW